MNTGKQKILIVDDEKPQFLALRAYFKRNYEMFYAPNGKAALNTLRTKTINLCIVDYQMQVMNGLELQQEIHTKFPQIQSIFLSGKADEHIFKNARSSKYGFRYLLKKPVDPLVLEWCIKKCVTYFAKCPTGLKFEYSHSTPDEWESVSDEKMMAAIAERDGYAVEQLYKRYFNDVYRYVLREAKDEHIAEDITQETFIKAFKKAHMWRQESKLLTWLCAIAYNEIMNHFKINKRDTENKIKHGKQNISIFPFLNDVSFVDIRNQDEVYKALEQLPKKHRKIIKYKYLSKLSHAEIAQRMGMKRQSAMNLLLQAKMKFKKIVKKLNFFE